MLLQTRAQEKEKKQKKNLAHQQTRTHEKEKIRRHKMKTETDQLNEHEPQSLRHSEKFHYTATLPAPVRQLPSSYFFF
jgi:hypothetical protein